MNKHFTVNNLSVNYGQVKVLDNIAIYINKGEIVSLIGSNGAGKSTLLKAVMGIIQSVNGEIYFNNNINITGQSTHKIVDKGICLIPEGRQIFGDMNVQENLEMGAYLNNNKQDINNQLNKNYQLFPILYDRRKQKAAYLSGGEQQMLAIARALMSKPELLLLDEPSLGLAPLITKEIFEAILKIRETTTMSILLIEQNARIALKISDRGYVLENGHIILEDISSKLLKNPMVKAAYLGMNN